MTFKSMDSLQTLLTDIIPYLPNNIKNLSEKKWFGGIFINSFGLIQSTATGEFLKNPMMTFNQDESSDGSCIVALVNVDGVLEIRRESCINQNYFLCEQIPKAPKPFGIKIDFEDLIKEVTILKMYNHTTNSLSACMAYCGMSQVVFRGTDCACIEDLDDKNERLGECEHILPCPGNILQSCGCKVKNDDKVYPIGVEVNTTSLLQFEFSSCLELRKQGVLMDYGFVNGTNVTLDCDLWSEFSSLLQIMIMILKLNLFQVAFVKKIGLCLNSIVFMLQVINLMF